MNAEYKKTVDFLFNALPMFQRQGATKDYKFSLAKIQHLLERLDFPDRAFPVIHIGGTNGKGSTSHILAAVLQSSGLKVGLFTSPHLVDFRERIRVNGKSCSTSFVVDFVRKHKHLISDLSPSFFEWTTLMGYCFFRQEDVDIAIIEVGMGGRLDSTNTLMPVVSVITNIGLDHQEFLGDNLEMIAEEKAGIIKPHTPVVIGADQPSIHHVFIRHGIQKGAPVLKAFESEPPEITTDLKGSYQKDNLRTASKVIDVLNDEGWSISKEAWLSGCSHVAELTGLRGRWEQLSSSPMVIADTAHNVDGFNYVHKQLRDLESEHYHVVFASVKGKDLRAILSGFPEYSTFYFSEPNIPRKLLLDRLTKLADELDIAYHTFPTVNQAFDAAKKVCSKDEVIFIGGSTFTVAEILSEKVS